MLNAIPDCDASFFCFPSEIAVYIIAILGIIHPFFWLRTMCMYGSELFLVMYVMVGVWSVLSIVLIYGIVEELACIYSLWIVYTFVFCFVMVGMMFLLCLGFCALRMNRKAFCVLVAAMYYGVTLYFVLVVNSQRKALFSCESNTTNTTNTTNTMNITGTMRMVYLRNDEATTPDIRTWTWSVAFDADAAGLPPDIQDFILNALARNMVTLEPKLATEDGKRALENHTKAGVFNRATDDSIASIGAFSRTTTDGGLTSGDVSSHTATDEGLEVISTTQFIPPMAAVLAAKPFTGGMMKRTESPTAVKSGMTVTMNKRLWVMAKLADLLINSVECRKPRKPAHGRFTYMRERRGAVLRINLLCNHGYRANTDATLCKYNWWDKPLPKCRKRKPPHPLPLPDGGCKMPSQPKHGEYRVPDHFDAKPGDRITADNVILVVSCDAPYQPVDPYVVCVEGRWRHAPPSCRKHCRLSFDQSVQYKCLKEYKDEFLACTTWQPDGTIVDASCKPGHAHRGPFKYMKCKEENWDHVVSCEPNANFTR